MLINSGDIVYCIKNKFDIYQDIIHKINCYYVVDQVINSSNDTTIGVIILSENTKYKYFIYYITTSSNNNYLIDDLSNNNLFNDYFITIKKSRILKLQKIENNKKL